MIIHINSLSELNDAAKQLLTIADTETIFLFYGEMGAGKTTFINNICSHLGVTEHTSSPTFSIVNEYHGKERKIYHFDFYRIKTQTEAFDLGYEEYFYSDSYCFIEWPEKIPDLLPKSYVKIELKIISETEREIVIEKVSISNK